MAAKKKKKKSATKKPKTDLDDLKKKWWWVTEKVLPTPDSPAWAWELLRRSPSYQKLCIDFSELRERYEEMKGPSHKGGLSSFVLGAQFLAAERDINSRFSSCSNADPRLNWSELYQLDASPDLPWPELSNQAKSFIKYNPIIPRFGFIGASHPISIDDAFVHADAKGVESAVHPILGHRKEKATFMGKLSEVRLGERFLPEFRVLPPDVSKLHFVVITFDIRPGRNAVLRQFDYQWEEWWKQSHPGKGSGKGHVEAPWKTWAPGWMQELAGRNDERITSRSGTLVPAEQEDFAQAWIPIGFESVGVKLNFYEFLRKRLSTFLTPRRIRTLLVRCRELWTVRNDAKSGLIAKSAIPEESNVWAYGLMALDALETGCQPKHWAGRWKSLLPEEDPSILDDYRKQVRRVIERI